jgi:hypothetical protein
MYPSLSADGKRMVWGTMDQPKAYLAIHDMATRDEKRFPVRLGSFSFQSPITNRILIKSQEPKLNLKDFFAMDPNTGATTPFLSVNNMHVHYSLSATFSHDEKEFYYLDPFSKYPGNVVMAMNIAAREQRELCQCGKIYGLALSPDGKHLVTERALGANQWELALIPVAGGPASRAFKSTPPGANSTFTGPCPTSNSGPPKASFPRGGCPLLMLPTAVNAELHSGQSPI